MRYICISGNTGAGKSTLLSFLADALRADARKVVAVDENTLHHRLIQCMFDDPAAWGLTIQLNFLVERAAIIREHAMRGDGLLLLERSQSEDPIFFERLVRKGFVGADLLSAYHAVRAALMTGCPEPAGYVFVRAAAEVCLERLNRAMEAGTRPAELHGPALEAYVQELDIAYDAWSRSLPPGTSMFTLDVEDVSGPTSEDLARCVAAVRGWTNHG